MALWSIITSVAALFKITLERLASKAIEAGPQEDLAAGRLPLLLGTVLGIGLVLMPCVAIAGNEKYPPSLPSAPPIANITGNWQFIPVPLPERNVTNILVSRAGDRIWLATPGGVAIYDGVQATRPQFETVEVQQSIFVNSLVEAADGSVIIGTKNDSLWRWKGDSIVPLYGSCPRGSDTCGGTDWALARSDDGRIYVASSFFAPDQIEALSALKAAVSERVVAVRVPASYLGFAGEELVAVSAKGSVYVIDRSSGESIRQLELDLGSRTFVRNVSYGPEVVRIGTDSQCLSLGLNGDSRPLTLATGNCTAVYGQKDGTTWLSTDFLYRHDLYGWTRWSPGQSGAISAYSVTEDAHSNVWIGTPQGLWRYFDVSRENRFFGEQSNVSSMLPTEDGGVIVGLENGEAWRLTRDFVATQFELPPQATVPASPSYRGALVANDGAGNLWVVTSAGLFRVDGGTKVKRVADYPLSFSEGSSAPSSLAVSPDGKACVGLSWSTNVLCLVDGTWRESAEVTEYFGGSFVGALAFDEFGSMLAVGTRSITVMAESLTEVGPFKPTPFGRAHGFGAVHSTPLIEGADFVATGGWGGTVFLKRSGSEFADVGHGGPEVQDQPYLIRQFASHPELGLLAASDEGLYRWEGTPTEGAWRSLRDIDPRLALPLAGIVPSSGRGFWIASGASVILLDLPVAAPTIDILRSPSSQTIDTNSVRYRLLLPGLVGLPTSKTATVTYDPPIPNAERHIVGPDSQLSLSELADITTYQLTATVTDGFLNVGSPNTSSFSVRLPFYRNPYKLAAAILAVLALAGVMITRRGPTGFLLRRIGGLRWTTEISDPRFAIGVTNVGKDTVRFELDAPSTLTPIRMEVDVPSLRLQGRPKEVLPYLVGVAEGRGSRLYRENFDSAISSAAEVLGSEAFPENLRFVTSQVGSGALRLDISKSLLWLPLELANDGGGDQVLLRYAIGRTVSADFLAATKPPQSSRLKVGVYAPHIDASLPHLPRTALEVKAVAAAARSWGADVTQVRPEATKTEVLDVLANVHIFHYAGHAEFVSEAAGQSYLPIQGGRIMAEDVASALRSRPHSLMLAFINGCGSSREGTWERGAEVYGFGSAFLNNAAYFIGAQWPIGDEFAASFAEEFYARLFPPAYSIWWRLIRRDTLEGMPFAEALRLARVHVREMGSAATQTWSSYVFYGDPTRRLVLQ